MNTAVKIRHSNKYYSKSNKKDSKINSIADYKIRIYISIKDTAKYHSYRECKH